jgi:hypothetical protein
MVAALTLALEDDDRGKLRRLVGRAGTGDSSADDQYVCCPWIAGAQDVRTCAGILEVRGFMNCPIIASLIDTMNTECGVCDANGDWGGI